MAIFLIWKSSIKWLYQSLIGLEHRAASDNSSSLSLNWVNQPERDLHFLAGPNAVQGQLKELKPFSEI